MTQNPQSEIKNPKSVDPKLKILLIEDNPAFVRLLQEELAEAGGGGFELEHAGRLGEAQGRLEGENFQLIILDLSLPDSNGLETFIKIHDQSPEVPIVVLSGWDDEMLAVRAVREGAQDYLVKGQVNGHSLIRSIQYAVERHALLLRLKKHEKELEASEEGFHLQRDVYAKEVGNLTRQFEEKIRELSVVRWIGDSLKFTRDIQKVFEVIIDTILAETSAEGCSIMLINRDSGDIVIRAARCQTDESAIYFAHDSASQRRFKLGEGIAGWVAQHGEPVFITDTSKDSRFLDLPGCATPEGSLLCTPLVIDNELVGVINLSHPRVDAISAEDERLMAIVTGQVAIALNNVQIFEDMQQLNRLLEEEVGKATDKLRQSEENLRELFDHAPVGYLEFDTEGHIVQINRTALTMFGYTEGEMLGRHPWDFIEESEVSQKAFSKKMAGAGPGQSYERTWRRMDGTILPSLMEDRILIGNGGKITGLRSTVQDISERKRAEEAMKEADQLRVLAETAGAAAHEINQPLTIAVGRSDILLMKMGKDDPNREEIEHIRQAAKRISEIIQKMGAARRYVTTDYAMGAKIVDFDAASKTEGPESEG